MKAMFDSVQDLAKFYNARAGVEWTSDPYEWIGSICVDFNLDILSAKQIEEKIQETQLRVLYLKSLGKIQTDISLQ